MRSSASASRKLSQSGDIPRSTKGSVSAEPQKRQIAWRVAVSVTSTGTSHRLARDPAQVRVEPTFRQQSGDPPDPQEAIALEVVPAKTQTLERVAELDDARRDVPARREPGQRARQLAEVDPVAAGIGARALRVLDRAAGDRLPHQLRDVAHAVVLARPAHVERLSVHEPARGSEHVEARAAEVLDVHERAPRRAVALEPDPARREGPADEIVHDEVAAQAR